MKAKDIYSLFEAQQELFEVDMSPSNLKKLASAIPGVKVGIEFEMIVPDVQAGDDDDEYEYEEDYSYDEDADSIDSIIRFFGSVDDNMGRMNDRRDLEELSQELFEMFAQYRDKEIDRIWTETDEGKEYFAKWVKENVDPDEIAEFAEKDPDLLGDTIPDKEDYDNFIDDQWYTEGSYYDEAQRDFRDEKIDEDDFSQYDFLEDAGIDTMSDVPRKVDTNIRWPFYTSPESYYNEGDNIDSVGDNFSGAIGKRVYTSGSYHGAKRSSDAYSLEPDGSLEPSNFKIVGEDGKTYLQFHGNFLPRDEDAKLNYLNKWLKKSRNKPNFKDQEYTIETRDHEGEKGLEFISPPMPVDEMIDDLKAVKKWADKRGCNTNNTTGLHINVSIPNYSLDKLDYVKLAILLGDKYVLEQFGRYGAYYAESAIDIIKERAKNNEDATRLLKQLRGNMETIASKIIHSGNTQKFTSINTKDKYIEFRSAGGDWLDENFDKIEDTLLRYVVALDAACDPEKYKKEYRSKLTKLFLTDDKTVKYYDPSDPENRLPGPGGPGTGAVNPVPNKFINVDDFESEAEYKEYLKKNRKDLRTYIQNDNALSNFAKLMAGEIDTKQYIQELEKVRKERLKSGGIGILHKDDVDENDWEITYDDGTKQETIYIANTAKVPDDEAAFNAAKKFKPQWFKPNTIEYITIKPFKFGEEFDDLKLYRAEYGHKYTSVVADDEEWAEEYVRAMDPEYFSATPNVEIKLTDENETSKRKISQILDWQTPKIERGYEWLKRPKIWRAVARGYERYYIAATTREEALEIATKLEPSMVNSPNFEMYVSDSYPEEDTFQYHKNLQNQRILQNELMRSGEGWPRIWRVTGTSSSGVGRYYIAAPSEKEVVDVVTRLDPEMAASDNFAMTVEDERPAPDTYDSYEKAQEDLIRRRNEPEPQIDIDNLKVYRIHNTNGLYTYIVAENGAEAVEIASKTQPDKFSDIASLTAQEQSGGTFGPLVITNMYKHQQSVLSELPEQSSDINIPAELQPNQPTRISDMRSWRVQNRDTGEMRWVAAASEQDARNRAREQYPEFADGMLYATPHESGQR